MECNKTEERHLLRGFAKSRTRCTKSLENVAAGDFPECVAWGKEPVDYSQTNLTMYKQDGV